MKKLLHFEKAQTDRFRRLLDMLYKPSELSEELGVELRAVYAYLQAGCPFSRDEHNRIWINGAEFRAWADRLLMEKRPKKQSRPRLAPDEAYCVRCKQIVPVGAFQLVTQVNSGVAMVAGPCPICQKPVFRLKGVRA
jgi:hypothetical protein